MQRSGIGRRGPLARIEAALEARWPGGWTIEVTYAKRSPRGMTRLFRARQDKTGRLVAVKANADPVMNRRQYNALVRMSEAVTDCVRVFDLAADESFFLMEWQEGRLLRELMTGPHRLDAIAGAGRWLRRLHQATSEVRQRVDPLVEEPADLRRGEGPERDVVVSRLRERQAALPTLAGVCAMLHTDFQMHNLFWLDGRVVAFDRMVHRDGLVYFDVARFCVTSALHRGVARANGESWPDDIESDRRAFFEGYGPIPKAQLDLYDYVEDLTLARTWQRFAMLARDDETNRLRADVLRPHLEAQGLLGDGPVRRPLRLVSRGLLRPREDGGG